MISLIYWQRPQNQYSTNTDNINNDKMFLCKTTRTKLIFFQSKCEQNESAIITKTHLITYL